MGIEEAARYSPVLQTMIKQGLPLTRATYVALAYGPDEPAEWTAEHEADLPDPFQREGAINKHGDLED